MKRHWTVKDFGEAMTEIEALSALEDLPEPEFQEFFASLPERVKLCCKGGLVDWRKSLPQWFIKYRQGGKQ